MAVARYRILTHDDRNELNTAAAVVSDIEAAISSGLLVADTSSSVAEIPVQKLYCRQYAQYLAAKAETLRLSHKVCYTRSQLVLDLTRLNTQSKS